MPCAEIVRVLSIDRQTKGQWHSMNRQSANVLTRTVKVSNCCGNRPPWGFLHTAKISAIIVSKGRLLFWSEYSYLVLLASVDFLVLNPTHWGSFRWTTRRGTPLLFLKCVWETIRSLRHSPSSLSPWNSWLPPKVCRGANLEPRCKLYYFFCILLNIYHPSGRLNHKLHQ